MQALSKSTYQIPLEQKYYECLEVDEFWTFVGNKRINNYLFTLTIEKQERL
ncbi:putative tnpA [Acinetobacter baumannii 348935]|nr:putative tnpA [Acinetobacter baumannii 348935]